MLIALNWHRAWISEGQQQTSHFTPASQDHCGREDQATCQKVFTVHLAEAEPGETGGGTGRGDADLDLGNHYQVGSKEVS